MDSQLLIRTALYLLGALEEIFKVLFAYNRIAIDLIQDLSSLKEKYLAEIRRIDQNIAEEAERVAQVTQINADNASGENRLDHLE